MLAATIGVVTILFILSYLIFDKDLLAPPTAVALVFLFGTLCAFYNEKDWGLEFSIKSMGLISTGIISTMIGGIIGVVILSFIEKRSITFLFSHKITKPEEINVSPLKTYIIIAVQLLAFVLIANHIRQLTGISNVVLAVSQYRLLTGRLADVNDLSIRMPILTRNLGELSRMIGIIYAYIVGNNLVASKKKISLNWVPIIIYSLTTFIQGDRSNMLRLWVVVLVVAYTIHRRSVGWRSSRETKKVIRLMVISVILIGALFSGVREFVGRESDMDPLQYVTFYAGSPIAVLDQLWTGTITRPEIFGYKTLYYLNQSLTALIGWPGRYNYYSEFVRSPNGAWIGNAPTAFKPAYVDFGFGGFFLVMMVFGIFFTVLYCKCRERQGNSYIDFRLMIYAYIAYVFLMYFYASFFDFLSHVMIKYMIELFLLRWFLVGWDFKRRFHFTFGKRKRKNILSKSDTV